MKYQQGVYITRDLSYGSTAPDSRIHHMAQSGLIYIFVYRSEDGSTGFEGAACHVLEQIALKSVTFESYRGVLREGLEFGDGKRALQIAFSDSSGGVAIVEPDVTLREENERIPEFRRQMKIFEFKHKRGLPAIAPEPPTIVRLGIGTCAPTLLDYLREHCAMLLVSALSEWGVYFRSINGSSDAKAYLLEAFAAARVPVFEVASERDLPVW